MTHSVQAADFERWLAHRLDQAVARREIAPTLPKQFWAEVKSSRAAVRLIEELARIPRAQAETLLQDLESKNPRQARQVLQSIAEGWIRQQRAAVPDRNLMIA